MNSTLSVRPGMAAAKTAAPSATLSPAMAFYLQVSIAVSFLAGSSAPTPLYSTYQAHWGFSSIMVTVVFGVYALAVLAALLVFGSLSDYIGRRPVLIAASFVQALTMLLFASAGSVDHLLIARVVQGVATGSAAAAVGAAMLDIDRIRGTVANAVAPIMGTALGALLGGVMAQYLPAPTHLVYLLLAVVFVVQGVAVMFMPETAGGRAGAWASLRPQFQFPPAVMKALVPAVPVLVAVWALAGFYASLGPAALRILTGSASLFIGGVTLFTMAGSGGLAVLALRNFAGPRMMALGAGGLATGVPVTLAGLVEYSTLIFFVGAVIAGAGFGAGFQGAVRSVMPHAAAHERAGVLSLVYVVSYFALGVPAVIGGFRVMHGGGVYRTALEYGVAVTVLALLALAAMLAQRRSKA
ncbi:MAG TPA: MFS transporter [Burkholderiales bacterium]|nr:MFS transporter [Burkholderiales bacterium]